MVSSIYLTHPQIPRENWREISRFIPSPLTFITPLTPSQHPVAGKRRFEEGIYVFLSAMQENDSFSKTG